MQLDLLRQKITGWHIRRKAGADIRDGIHYRRSRTFFNIDCALTTTIGNFASSTYIAALILYLGGTDSLIGIINALPLLAMPLQILSAYLFDRVLRRKKLCVTFAALIKAFQSAIFLIPLAVGNAPMGLPLMITVYVLMQVFTNLSGASGTNWLIDLVPENIRGRYFANRESLGLVISGIFMLISGKLVDELKAGYGPVIAFGFIGFLILGIAVVNIIFLSCCDEPKTKQAILREEQRKNPQPEVQKKHPLALLKEPFSHKGFVAILLLNVLWNVSSSFGGPFSGAYQVNTLQLSFTYIMTLSVISMGIRVFLVPLAGRIAGRVGYYPVAVVSMLLIAVHYVLWAFTIEANKHILLPLLFVESAIGFAGINICLFNIQIEAMPEEIRTTCFSVMNTICGFAGFFSTLIASGLLKLFNEHNLVLLGFPFSGMQILFFVTAILMFGCGFFTLRISKNKPRTIPERSNSNET